tara:strand:+ start:1845 stop:2138 length:294 start_codon:yes stop_codon:yes gene_type:complete
LAIVKSELLKELKKSYPNFLTRDLNKIIEIVLKEIKLSLNKGEGVELRNFGTFRTNIQRASIRRNPKTGEKVNVPEKKTIKWKMSKDLFKKLNNDKE